MIYIFVMKLEKNWRAITFAGTRALSLAISIGHLYSFESVASKADPFRIIFLLFG